MKLSLRVLLGVSYLAFCGAWWTQAGVSNDERLTGYVHDTIVNPFIVTGDGKELGDPMPVYWDGVWHLYALSVDLGAVPHFTSTDLVKWVEHEPAMVGKDIATGTVLRHENKYYLQYRTVTLRSETFGVVFPKESRGVSRNRFKTF